MRVISRETGELTLPKFMQTLNDHSYKELERLAKQRGITVQELIRAVIIPEWVNEQKESDKSH